MHVYDWNLMQPEAVTELYRRTVAQGEKMSVARLEVAKGSSTRAHRHENEEVIILLKGCWHFHFNTGDVMLRPNQMLTITPAWSIRRRCWKTWLRSMCAVRHEKTGSTELTACFTMIPINGCGACRQFLIERFWRCAGVDSRAYIG